MRGHLTASLKRLQTDYADLYYLHRINPDIPVEDVAEVMGKLIRDGLIRGYGLSQVDVDTIERANAVTPLSAVQNIYSMLERGVEEAVIPYCPAHGIGVVPFSPVASGFLSGKITAGTDFSHSDDVRKYVPQLRKENLEANQPILALLEYCAARKNATRGRYRLAGCCTNTRMLCRFPVLKIRSVFLKILLRGMWRLPVTNLPHWRRHLTKSPCTGIADLWSSKAAV